MDRSQRRAETRRRAQVRRRRAVGLLALAALVAGGVAVGLALGGGGSKRKAAPTATHTRPVTTTHGATTTAAAPVARGPHNAAVPILMYHVIGTAPAAAPLPELFVTRADFEGQMRWLAAHGYHGVTLRRVYDYWTKGSALPARPVVLSFDDGYLGDYTNAMPVLHAHGWPGVLNLEVRNARPGNIGVGQVAALVHAGWELDAHTITHPDLRHVGDAQLRQETLGAREQIRRQYHVPVDFFCYPAGMYDDHVIAAVRAAGYLAATTVNFGLASPRNGMFTLDRVRIDGSDGVVGFATKLRTLGGGG